MLKNINKLFLSVFLLGTLASAEPGLVSRDLFFLPLSGEFQSKSQFNYETRKETTEVVSPVDLSTASFTLGEGLSYAFYDDLVVGAQVGFKTLKQDSKNLNNSTSGLLDPSFSILYRVYDQSYSPVFFDMSLALSPYFGKHRSNNVLRGSTEADFELSLGQELYAWAYKLSLYSTWFSREITGGSASDSIIQSRFDLGGKAALQYDFDPQWAANFELGLRLPGKRQDDKSTGYQDPNYEFSFATGPVYQFHRDLSGAFKLYTKYEKGTFYAANKTTNYHATTYGINLALDYIF